MSADNREYMEKSRRIPRNHCYHHHQDCITRNAKT
uniref:Uncharacterized protein n=1 Tax=Rhizophora mucronata TaxID=61149 RepID=A0A2P2PUT8_RHIMU